MDHVDAGGLLTTVRPDARFNHNLEARGRVAARPEAQVQRDPRPASDNHRGAAVVERGAAAFKDDVRNERRF